jgi:glucokinase
MHALAIDLGGIYAKCAVVRDDTILACREIAADCRRLRPLLPVLATALVSLLREACLHAESCAGLAIMDVRLLRGKHYQAGCLGGHLLANWNGHRCNCGAVGYAEAEASTWALPTLARGWPGFTNSALVNEELLDFAALFRAADSGDRVANEILCRSIRIWSAATVSLIHANDRELIVFGGGVMNRGDAILPKIQAYVDEHAWTPWGRVKLVRSALGPDAALYGAIPLLKESHV